MTKTYALTHRRPYGPYAFFNLLLILGGVFLKTASAGTYPADLLANSGVVFKDGMYFCTARDTYIRPYDTYRDVGECAFATKEKEICSESSNTEWRSGRCFCPELQKYYVESINGEGYFAVRPSLFESSKSLLDGVSIAIKACPKFTHKEYPIGRTLKLKPRGSDPNAGYTVEKLLPHLDPDDRRDNPGEQGHPGFPAKINEILDLRLGFGCNSDESFNFPPVDVLIANIHALDKELGYFPVEGELTGRKYLEEFIAGHLPIGRIEGNGDAIFYLHDLNFHIMGFLLLPKAVRGLAQKQTKFLLDFIDDFKTRHPAEWSKPEFKLLLEKLIEDQIVRIDVGTGDLTQYIFHLLEGVTTRDEFLAKISGLKPLKRAELHAEIMRITGDAGGATEKMSAKAFLEGKKSLYSKAFEESDKSNQEIFKRAITEYIDLKSSEPEFTDDIKIDSYHDIYFRQKRKYGSNAVDLFVERIGDLKKLRDEECNQQHDKPSRKDL